MKFALVVVLLTCRTAAAAERPPQATAPPRASVGPAPSDRRPGGQDWPSFLGPGGDSKSPETGILRDWKVTPPRLVWSTELGASYGTCAIGRGRCFQFDRVGDQARLRCLASETGQELWRYTYPTHYVDAFGYNGGPRCAPVLDGRRVYLYGAAGQLHCVREGQLLWKVDTFGEFGVVPNFFGVGSTPVVSGELLLVMVGGSPPASQNSPPGQLELVQCDGSAIVAFDKRTGAVRYRTGDELASYASLKLAEFQGRPWAFAFCRGGLLAFDPRDGTPDFHFPWRAKILESVNASTPVVVGNQVLLAETYGPGSALLSVTPHHSPQVVWQDDVRRRSKSLATHWNTAIHHEGYLYGSSGRHSQGAELRCVRWQTGEVVWRQPGLTRSSLMYVDGHLVCLSEDGTLRLLLATPDSYQEVSQLALGSHRSEPGSRDGESPLRGLLNYPAWAAPVLSHGLLYVRGKDRLICLELIPERDGVAPDRDRPPAIPH